MAGDSATKATYFIAPGWDLRADTITLGSVITDPTQPQLSIFTPDPEDLDSIQTTTKSEFTGKPLLHRDGITGLFGTFLDLHGLGNEAPLQYDRHAVLSYRLTGIKTTRFTPSAELKRQALAPGGRVAQYLQASTGPAPVFMVTGVKTVTGASVTTASAKGTAWRVTLSVGAEPAANEAAAAVFAFRLEELSTDDKSRVLQGVEDRGLLKNGLDRVFGKDVFTILDGVDESEESSCRIIASSPTYVDLLTASSARIGRDSYRSSDPLAS